MELTEDVVELGAKVGEGRHALERPEIVDELGDARPHARQRALSPRQVAPAQLGGCEQCLKEQSLGVGERFELAHAGQMQHDVAARVSAGLANR